MKFSSPTSRWKKDKPTVNEVGLFDKYIVRATKSGSGQGAEKTTPSQLKPKAEGRTTNKTRISLKAGVLVVKKLKRVKLVNKRVQASRETIRQTQGRPGTPTN